MKKLLVLASAAILMGVAPSAVHAKSSKTVMSFKTTLSGMKAVPRGDMHGTGTATFNVNAPAGKICYSMTVKGIMGKALAAHIHAGKAGKAGPVVVTLATPGANGRAVGCVKVSASVAKAIEANPTSYYVNVHTKEYAAGAVRGQL